MRADENAFADWAEAEAIAAKFPNKRCLQAAAALAKRFGASATILFVDTTPYAAAPYIEHTSLPGDVISETGDHFAVELHGRVFDNITPRGAPLAEWASAFGFATKRYTDATFADVPIQRFTYLEFLAYLKRTNHTPLGRVKRPRQARRSTPP